MNVPTLNIFEVVVVAIEAVTPHVPYMAQSDVTYWYLNTVTGVAHCCSAAKTICWLHAHHAHSAVAQLLGNFCQHLDVLAI